jgi:large subunit ribosomal protein L22
MEATAILRDAPFSPRKMRYVADMIRGRQVSWALNALKFETKQGGRYLHKLLLSAVSNWENKNPELLESMSDLYIKEIRVDGGRHMKRVRPAPQGRAYRVRKRSNHVTLVVDIPANAFAQQFLGSEELVSNDVENVSNESTQNQD